MPDRKSRSPDTVSLEELQREQQPETVSLDELLAETDQRQETVSLEQLEQEEAQRPSLLDRTLQSLARTPYAAYGILENLTEMGLATAGSLWGTLETIALGKYLGRPFQETLPQQVGLRVKQLTDLYDPQTPEGRWLQQKLGELFETVGAAGEGLAEKVFEKTGSPAAAAAARVAPEAALMLGPVRVAKGAGRAVKAAREGMRLPRIEQPRGDIPIPELSFKSVPARTIQVDRRALSERPDFAETVSVLEKVTDTDRAQIPVRVTIDQKGKIVPASEQDAVLAAALQEVGAKRVQVALEKKPMPREVREAHARRVERVYKAMERENEAAEALAKGKWQLRLKRQFLDVQAPIKAVLDKGGPLARRAKMRLELASGATPWAHLQFARWDNLIYRGLSKEEKSLLDRIIMSRAIIDIDRRKGPGTVRHPGKLTGAEHEAYLRSLRDRLGPEKFGELNARATGFFKATEELLSSLRDEGIISPALYEKLRHFEYEPRRFLDFIEELDPTYQVQFGGKRITVSESGVQFLGAGADAALRLDSRQLLEELAVRTANRIMRNRANKALAQAAPELRGLVQLPKKEPKRGPDGRITAVHPPEGMVPIFYWEGGKQHVLYMDKAIAEAWITSSPQMSATMANILRTVSGTSLTKAAATGFNPEFALTNLPRDIAHAYLANSGIYSKHLPIYLLQLARDYAATAKDAWLRRGLYEQMAREGMLMDFLTTQGRNLWELTGRTGERPFEVRLGPRARTVLKALSYVNETSEIWTRLAVAKRALRQGKTLPEAAWEARSLLDFAQGGFISKGLDNVLPYLNASIQAARTALRNWKRDPKRAATTWAWLVGVKALHDLAAMANNPEGWEQVPWWHKLRGFVFLLPPEFNVRDRQGNSRPLYFYLPMDNLTAAATLPFTLSMYRYMYGRPPPVNALEQAWELVNVIPEGGMPPVVRATASYAANYDFWRDEAIWQGPHVPPQQEVYRYPRKETPLVWVRLSEILDKLGVDASPVRMQGALRAVLPQNPYSDSMGMAFRYLLEGVPRTVQEMPDGELLLQVPIIRRAVHMGHPLAAMEAAREQQETLSGVKLQLAQTVDRMAAEFARGELPGGERSVRAWLEAQPLEYRQNLLRRFRERVRFEKVRPEIVRATEAYGVPSPSVWLSMRELDPETRAETYFWYWRGLDPAGRAAMDRIAKRAGFFTSSRFASRLIELRRRFEETGGGG